MAAESLKMSQPDAPEALYEAINARDAQALLASMTEDFVGEVSAGMPLGVGAGTTAGRRCLPRFGDRSLRSSM